MIELRKELTNRSQELINEIVSDFIVGGKSQKDIEEITEIKIPFYKDTKGKQKFPVTFYIDKELNYIGLGIPTAAYKLFQQKANVQEGDIVNLYIDGKWIHRKLRMNLDHAVFPEGVCIFVCSVEFFYKTFQSVIDKSDLNFYFSMYVSAICADIRRGILKIKDSVTTFLKLGIDQDTLIQQQDLIQKLQKWDQIWWKILSDLKAYKEIKDADLKKDNKKILFNLLDTTIADLNLKLSNLDPELRKASNFLDEFIDNLQEIKLCIAIGTNLKLDSFASNTVAEYESDDFRVRMNQDLIGIINQIFKETILEIHNEIKNNVPEQAFLDTQIEQYFHVCNIWKDILEQLSARNLNKTEVIRKISTASSLVCEYLASVNETASEQRPATLEQVRNRLRDIKDDFLFSKQKTTVAEKFTIITNILQLKLFRPDKITLNFGDLKNFCSSQKELYDTYALNGKLHKSIREINQYLTTRALETRGGFWRFLAWLFGYSAEDYRARRESWMSILKDIQTFKSKQILLRELDSHIEEFSLGFRRNYANKLKKFREIVKLSEDSNLESLENHIKNYQKQFNFQVEYELFYSLAAENKSLFSQVLQKCLDKLKNVFSTREKTSDFLDETGIEKSRQLNFDEANQSIHLGHMHSKAKKWVAELEHFKAGKWEVYHRAKAMKYERPAHSIEYTRNLLSAIAGRNHFDAHYELGRLANLEEKTEEANQHYKTASDHGNVQASYQLGFFAEKQGNLENAISYYAKASARDKDAFKSLCNIFLNKLSDENKNEIEVSTNIRRLAIPGIEAYLFNHLFSFDVNTQRDEIKLKRDYLHIIDKLLSIYTNGDSELKIEKDISKVDKLKPIKDEVEKAIKDRQESAQRFLQV